MCIVIVIPYSPYRALFLFLQRFRKLIQPQLQYRQEPNEHTPLVDQES